MIISKNTNPERDLYYLGGQVIDILASSDNTQIDYFELYVRVNHAHDISMNLYVQVLDWLFILGVIKNSDNRYIERCF